MCKHDEGEGDDCDKGGDDTVDADDDEDNDEEGDPFSECGVEGI